MKFQNRLADESCAVAGAAAVQARNLPAPVSELLQAVLMPAVRDQAVLAMNRQRISA